MNRWPMRLRHGTHGSGVGGMKKRVTVTMDPQLIQRARWVAKRYGLPLVALFERGLASVLRRYRHPKRLRQVRLTAGRKKTRRT